MSAIGRTLSLIILGLGCTSVADANDQPSSVAVCRDIADSTARLACFDRATAPQPAVPGHSTPAPMAAAPAAVYAAPTAPAAPVDSQQRFGLPEHKVVQQEVAAGTRDKDASKIQAHILRLQSAPDQRMVFTLDNSQVWRQLSPEGDLLAKAGDSVTISRGLLGSYWLQAPSGRGSKVSRLH